MLKVKFTRPEGHKHLVSCSCSLDPITNSEFTNSSNCVAILSCNTLVASLVRVMWFSQSEGLACEEKIFSPKLPNKRGNRVGGKMLKSNR